MSWSRDRENHWLSEFVPTETECNLLENAPRAHSAFLRVFTG